MRLLFDQNLSPRLVPRLSDLYPDSCHVSSVGLDRAADDEIWSYARANDYIIVTNDADFSDLASLHGFPPKVIWLRLGNSTTDQIQTTLRNNDQVILSIAGDATVGVLILR